MFVVGRVPPLAVPTYSSAFFLVLSSQLLVLLVWCILPLAVDGCGCGFGN